MIHCCAPKPIPKSVRIAGRATLIAVTEAIDEPRTVATSVRRRQAASESGLLQRKRRSKGCNRPMLSRSRGSADQDNVAGRQPDTLPGSPGVDRYRRHLDRVRLLSLEIAGDRSCTEI